MLPQTRLDYAAFLIALALPAASAADILLVSADGTGQYPTIQAAVDAAVDGDDVHLVAGTYTGEGNKNINFQGKAITIRSQDLAPKSVTIQLSYESYNRAFVFDSGEELTSSIQALTITGGLLEGEANPAVVLCINSSPTIRDCTFSDNYSACPIQNKGGAPHVMGCTFASNVTEVPNSNGGVHSEGGSIIIEDCSFLENTSWANDGGAVYINSSSSPSIIRRCYFRGNSGRFAGGAIATYDSGNVIEDCVFVNNTNWLGGAISGCATIRRCFFTQNSATENGQVINVSDGQMTIENCTFIENAFYHLPGIIEVYSSSRRRRGGLRIEKSIIAFNGAKAIEGNVASISCVDIFGNQGGDWVGDIADELGQNGNLSADPLFCDLDGGNHNLYSNSPCAPANSGSCGLIGAYDVACEPSSVEAKSWGKIKGMYR